MDKAVYKYILNRVNTSSLCVTLLNLTVYIFCMSCVLSKFIKGALMLYNKAKLYLYIHGGV